MNHLEICIQAALAGGRAAWICGPGNAVKKPSEVGAQHAIVTDADKASNKAILKLLSERDKHSLIMTEEEPTVQGLGHRLINQTNFRELKDSGAYIIDEVCGSSGHHVGHYEWATSVGYVEKLVHKSGATFAPEVYGGLGALFYASIGEGAFMRSRGEDKEVKVTDNNIEDSYVVFGADCVLRDKYPRHFELMGEISGDVRRINMNESCVLPLSLIAAGRIDALVQPPQSVWDYSGEIAMVEEAGGLFQFYETDDEGGYLPVEKLKIEHYNPTKKNVGFVAGNKKIVSFISEKFFELNRR